MYSKELRRKDLFPSNCQEKKPRYYTETYTPTLTVSNLSTVVKEITKLILMENRMFIHFEV